jgi:octanoyl-[GcvH]:protein N-octanoyltransferase
VLEDVYAALGLAWDPATTGSVADEVPDVSIENVQGALLAITPSDIASYPDRSG